MISVDIKVIKIMPNCCLLVDEIELKQSLGIYLITFLYYLST